MTGAIIEIIDPNPGSGILLPSKVLINGTDVGYITTDGITVDGGSVEQPTTVTITFLPSQVVFRSEAAA